MTDEEPKNEEVAAAVEPASEAVPETPAPEAAAAPVEPTPLTTERREAARAVVPVVEAMLFAAGKPVAVEKLAEAADLPVDSISDALVLLAEACAAPERGILLDRVAGGVRFASRPEHDDPIRTLLGLDGKTKLSMAALETLAIIAYRQPITAPDIAELRGVTSASSLKTLLDRKLITTAGRKEVVGTPFLYKTTKEFLVHFGLSEIAELPKPEELEALYGIEAPAAPDDGQKELFTEEEAEGPLPPAVTASTAEEEEAGDAGPGPDAGGGAEPEA